MKKSDWKMSHKGTRFTAAASGPGPDPDLLSPTEKEFLKCISSFAVVREKRGGEEERPGTSFTELWM